MMAEGLLLEALGAKKGSPPAEALVGETLTSRDKRTVGLVVDMFFAFWACDCVICRGLVKEI